MVSRARPANAGSRSMRPRDARSHANGHHEHTLMSTNKSTVVNTLDLQPTQLSHNGNADNRQHPASGPISEDAVAAPSDVFTQYNAIITQANAAGSSESTRYFEEIQESVGNGLGNRNFEFMNDQLAFGVDASAALGLNAVQMSPPSVLPKGTSFGMDDDFAPSVDMSAIFPQSNMLDTNCSTSIASIDSENDHALKSGSIVNDMNMRMSRQSPDATCLMADLPAVLCNQPTAASPYRSSRMVHAAEQRRRSVMKNCFQRLEDMLPQGIQKRRSKADLLESAVNELERLRHAEVAYRANIHILTVNLAQLNHQLACVDQYPKSNVAPSELGTSFEEQVSSTSTFGRPLAPRTSNRE